MLADKIHGGNKSHTHTHNLDITTKTQIHRYKSRDERKGLDFLTYVIRREECSYKTIRELKKLNRHKNYWVL